MHKQTINLNERKCQPTPPKLPLAFPFFPALRITFYRLTNEITDEIDQSDKSLLCWEDSDLERLSEFQMTTHIFGATDSPSCANFCLKRAAEDRKGRFSDEAVSAVDKDSYVDDFVKSVTTESEACSLAREVTCLLSEAGFRLTKWMSNS